MCRRLGLFRFWTESENEVIREHYGILSPAEVAALLPGRGRRAVMSQAQRLGLGGSYMHSVNRAFFDTVTPLVSYWAGFIAADGCVCPKSNSFTIGLSVVDVGHLERLKADVEYTGPVRRWVSTGGYKPGGEYAGLSICAVPEWLFALDRHYRVGPRKTKTLLPPLLDEDNSAAYIAGFIDGDGSIHIPKGNWTPGSVTVAVGGRRPVLEWIKGWFDRWAPARYNHRPAKVNLAKEDFWHYAVTGDRAKAVWLRFSAMGLPLLGRKWNKFIEADAIPKLPSSPRYWTEEQKNILREKYLICTAKEIGKLINKATGSVHRYARCLGLKKHGER